MDDIKDITCTRIQVTIADDVYSLQGKELTGPKYTVRFTIFDANRAIIGSEKGFFDTYEQAKEFYDSIK